MASLAAVFVFRYVGKSESDLFAANSEQIELIADLIEDEDAMEIIDNLSLLEELELMEELDIEEDPATFAYALSDTLHLARRYKQAIRLRCLIP